MPSGSVHATKPPSPTPSTFVACRLTTVGIAVARTAVESGRRVEHDRDTGLPAKRLPALRVDRQPERCDREHRAEPPGRASTSRSASSGASAPSLGSTSTSQGTKPAWTTACADAANVQAGSMHSVPGAAPHASSVATSPAVALATTATLPALGAPACSASRSSSSRTSGPRLEYQRAPSIRRRYGSSSSARGQLRLGNRDHSGRAGLPATTAPAATSRTTTAPMPTTA